jgi:hypothetical protein
MLAIPLSTLHGGNMKIEEFLKELTDVCKKYGVCLISDADAADDTNLSSCIQVCKITKEPGRYVRLETLLEVDEIGF